MSFLLAIDQGTTSSRAIAFDVHGAPVETKQKELKLICPHKGWVEQDPMQIVADTLAVARAVCSGRDIAALGITNQRETTVIWNRKTGQPIYNAIVWQDRRTAEVCADLIRAGHEEKIQHKTGLLIDPYFSATKIKWILDHMPEARAQAVRGDLAFGTIDTFLLWHLTGGKVHATDATNAARTMLFNIHTQKWDDELCALFNIPLQILPDVRDTVSDFGTTVSGILPHIVPVCALIGDQQAALVGQGCFTPGHVKITYGTGCFALMQTGPQAPLSRNRLLTTIAYRLGGRVSYALEGSIFVAGAAIQWLRDNLGVIINEAETEELARSVPNSNGVIFVPAFTGLGAPYWDAGARAAILGLTRESTKAHIVRAALEAQAYQTKDLMSAFRADTDLEPDIVRADGGLMNNRFIAQSIADILGVQLDVPRSVETTAWGAAALAGLGVGVYQNIEEIGALWARGASYNPVKNHTLQVGYAAWQGAIASVRHLSAVTAA